MRDQIELFDNNKQKKWVDDEDNMILNQDLLLEGILPKGRNIN